MARWGLTVVLAVLARRLALAQPSVSRQRVAWLPGLLLVLAPAAARADGTWLDQPIQQWNRPGQVVPPVPQAGGPLNPQCVAGERPIEQPEDAQVNTMGWRLVGPYTGGWGIVVVEGATEYDGMCR